jgi:hypothetical protein
MMILAKNLRQARKAYNPARGESYCMTAREFAQVDHNLDKRDSGFAYTPSGERWGWCDVSSVWVRICPTGWKAAYAKNGRRAN